MSNIFDELERCIEECEPYLSHLLKGFRKENTDQPPCHENVMRVYLNDQFAELVVTLVDPRKHGLSGPEAAATLRKLLETKECALKAMMP